MKDDNRINANSLLAEAKNQQKNELYGFPNPNASFFSTTIKSKVNFPSSQNDFNNYARMFPNSTDLYFKAIEVKQKDISTREKEQKMALKVEETEPIEQKFHDLIEIYDQEDIKNNNSETEEEGRGLTNDLLREINAMTNNTLSKDFLTELTKDICFQRELSQDDIFIKDNAELKENWVFHSMNDHRFIYNPDNETRWLIKDAGLLMENYQSDVYYQKVSKEEMTSPTENLAAGNATLDEFGNLHLKFWANQNEEKKNMKFIKIPKSFANLKNIFTSTAIRATLEILYRRYKKPRSKKTYKPREKGKAKQDRKPGAGRKVRSDNLEKFILQNLRRDYDETNILPERKDALKYAREWKNHDSGVRFATFKASKGWLDKFIKRNKRVFDHWAGSKNPQSNSEMSFEKIKQMADNIPYVEKSLQKTVKSLNEYDKFLQSTSENSVITGCKNKFPFQKQVEIKWINQAAFHENAEDKHPRPQNKVVEVTSCFENKEFYNKKLQEKLKVLEAKAGVTPPQEPVNEEGISKQLVANFQELSKMFDLNQLTYAFENKDFYYNVDVTNDKLDDMNECVFGEQNMDNVIMNDFEALFVEYNKKIESIDTKKNSEKVGEFEEIAQSFIKVSNESLSSNAMIKDFSKNLNALKNGLKNGDTNFKRPKEGTRSNGFTKSTDLNMRRNQYDFGDIYLEDIDYKSQQDDLYDNNKDLSDFYYKELDNDFKDNFKPIAKQSKKIQKLNKKVKMAVNDTKTTEF